MLHTCALKSAPSSWMYSLWYEETGACLIPECYNLLPLPERQKRVCFIPVHGNLLPLPECWWDAETGVYSYLCTTICCLSLNVQFVRCRNRCLLIPVHYNLLPPPECTVCEMPKQVYASHLCTTIGCLFLNVQFARGRNRCVLHTCAWKSAPSPWIASPVISLNNCSGLITPCTPCLLKYCNTTRDLVSL